jgi:hypothetical protein
MHETNRARDRTLELITGVIAIVAATSCESGTLEPAGNSAPDAMSFHEISPVPQRVRASIAPVS